MAHALLLRHFKSPKTDVQAVTIPAKSPGETARRWRSEAEAAAAAAVSLVRCGRRGEKAPVSPKYKSSS